MIPTSPRPTRNRGLVWEEKEEYDKAIADFDEAIRLDPKDAEAYNDRGEAWYAKDDLDKAIADYDEAIRLDPDFAEAYRNRGLLLRRDGEYDKAIADFNEAIRLDPKDAPGGVLPRRRLESEGRVRQGHRRLRYGHPTRARSPRGYLARGDAWLAKRDPDKAIADFSAGHPTPARERRGIRRPGHCLAREARFRQGDRRLQRGDPASIPRTP